MTATSGIFSSKNTAVAPDGTEWVFQGHLPKKGSRDELLASVATIGLAACGCYDPLCDRFVIASRAQLDYLTADPRNCGPRGSTWVSPKGIHLMLHHEEVKW